MASRKDNIRDERGVAIMYVAVFLVSSLWLVSLAVDMGKLMTTKTELQRAADAAALAGASAIDKEGGGGNLITAQSRIRAAAAAAANTALRETSESVTIDPDNDIDFPDVHTIHVQVHRDAANGNAMSTIFARSLGITALDVKADAKAKLIPLTKECGPLVPFSAVGVPGGFSTACGTTYTLHTQPGASNGGNFQLLDFPDCDLGDCQSAPSGGGAKIKWYIENGACCCVDIGTTFVDTKPGGTVGPVRQGLQFRFTQDTDKREGICYKDYIGNQSRVLLVPIVSTFAGLNGKTNATITGFAGFFMKTKPTGGANTMTVDGQFIDYIVPGTGGGNPPPNALYTIRLIE
jgi:Flp pilus assembly protein TadG